MNKSLGRRMAAARVEAGLSTEDMAKIVSRSAQAVRGYERGANQPPGQVLSAWAAATKKAVSWFFQDGIDEEVPPPAPGRVVHPGVEALAKDVDLRVEEGVTDEKIELLRSFRAQFGGSDVIIKTRLEAVTWLRWLQAAQQPRNE